MRKVASWYENKPGYAQVGLQASVVTVTAYGGALLSAVVADALHARHWIEVVVYLAMLLTLTLLAVLTVMLLRADIDRRHDQRRAARQALSGAYKATSQAMLDEITVLSDKAALPEVRVPHDPLNAIGKVIEAAHGTLAQHYGAAQELDEVIAFEVTYMTVSYRDGKITIAASANSERRQPQSMQLRTTSNPDIYGDTVTAQLFRTQASGNKPEPQVIDDTASAQYAALYPGQKDRIKSTVVFPVVDGKRKMLGTLVMHCDRTGFFSKSQEKFWVQFCEVFAQRLALDHLLLDAAQDGAGNPPSAWVPPPF